MKAKIRGTTLFFDIVGSGIDFTPEGVVEKPIVFLLHGGPGGDHSVFKNYCAELQDIAQLDRPQTRPIVSRIGRRSVLDLGGLNLQGLCWQAGNGMRSVEQEPFARHVDMQSHFLRVFAKGFASAMVKS